MSLSRNYWPACIISEPKSGMLWSGLLATGMSVQRLSKLWLIRTAAAYLGYAATSTRDVVWNKRERERGGRGEVTILAQRRSPIYIFKDHRYTYM